jgi:hypothetical protein
VGDPRREVGSTALPALSDLVVGSRLLFAIDATDLIVLAIRPGQHDQAELRRRAGALL